MIYFEVVSLLPVETISYINEKPFLKYGDNTHGDTPCDITFVVFEKLGHHPCSFASLFHAHESVMGYAQSCNASRGWASNSLDHHCDCDLTRIDAESNY